MLEVDSLNEGHDFVFNLTRAKFESECDFLFRKRPRFIDGPRNPILEPNSSSKDFLNSIITAATNLDTS